MMFLCRLFLVLALSLNVYAKEGDFGVEVDVSTRGIFPPKLDFY